MQEKITLKGGSILKISAIALFSFVAMFTSLKSSAQNYCANEVVIWNENYGAGTTVSSNPDVTNLTYSPTGNLEDIHYRVANNTQQKPEWHFSLDHTGNVNGKMLVVNGDAETFYRHTIAAPIPAGFLPGSYSASLYLMNINTPGTCAPNPLLPTFTFAVEYNLSATGTTGWVSLQSVFSSPVPQTATPTWILLGGVFQLPVSAQRVRLTLTDGTIHGCGNDFAIDDVKFATCPSGGPLPVQFSAINAVQKGSGVNVTWSTASESNNKYFDVERSNDGTSWKSVGTQNATGNSSISKSYSLYDPTPLAGANFYRVKQVDNDGKLKYSTVVKVNISIDQVAVSVLNNPFINNISVDFLGVKAQNVTVKLSDLTGKTIGTDKWSISNGRSVKSFDKVSNLSRGVYILTVIDETGAPIYNTKVVKQ